jgi:myo-inositol-1(or 4)-monophosphatase
VADLTDAQVAVLAAAAGAAEVRAAYGGRLVRYDKGGNDFATSADYASERAIRRTVAEHRPADAMLGEEEGLSGPADAERQWLVDPLCGTKNFAAQTPLVAVNVALRSAGPDVRVLAAASADPFSGEVFWTDGIRAAVRAAGRDTDVAADASCRLVDFDLAGPQPEVRRLVTDERFLASYDVRVSSSTLAMTWLAAGRRAGYVHQGDVRDSVHFSAPIAIARAAGCVVTGLHGQPLDTEPFGLLAAADPGTHAALLGLLLPTRP